MRTEPTGRNIRSTQAWRKLAKRVIQEEPICWLRLNGCTIRSTTGDHIEPTSLRPELALERSNVRGACKHCNDKRGNLPINMLDQLRCNTSELTTACTPNNDAAQQHSSATSRFFGGDRSATSARGTSIYPGKIENKNENDTGAAVLGA